MMRAPVILLGVLAPFFFPWYLGAALAFLASVYLPPLALFLGVLYDVLYFVPGASLLPLGTVAGILVFFCALLVHTFVKTRIMSA